MPSMAFAVLEWLDAYPEAPTESRWRALEGIPPNQFQTFFSELCHHCPSRRQPALERRLANALNVEIGEPMARCMEQSPDGRGAVWLLSGGSLLAYGLCSIRRCPRTQAPTDRGQG